MRRLPAPFRAQHHTAVGVRALLSAALVATAAPAAAQDTPTRFAPEPCGFQVTFPRAPEILDLATDDKPDLWGVRATDFTEGVFLFAHCIPSAPMREETARAAMDSQISQLPVVSPSAAELKPMPYGWRLRATGRATDAYGGGTVMVQLTLGRTSAMLAMAPVEDAAFFDSVVPRKWDGPDRTALGGGGFFHTTLPGGVAIALPYDTQVYVGDERVLVARGNEDVLTAALAASPPRGALTGFGNDAHGVVRLIFTLTFPIVEFTQDELRRTRSAETLAGIDDALRRDWLDRSVGETLLAWHGTTEAATPFGLAFVSRYRWSWPPDMEAFEERAVHIFDGASSMVLTIGYDRTLEATLGPMADAMQASLTPAP